MGEGVHSFVRPDGLHGRLRRDMTSTRMLDSACPGGDLKNLTLKMDANGFEVDSGSQPIRWCS